MNVLQLLLEEFLLNKTIFHIVNTLATTLLNQIFCFNVEKYIFPALTDRQYKQL